ncbi:MAG: formate--tetrahydrofolate ligase [Eubacteriales bacterium]|nr:formate--tetrahydrofolate ligase [Eubacteriales bacterium]
MKTDIEIARSASKKDIREIAAQMGIREEELILYGFDKAKLSEALIKRLEHEEDGQLILVTAITPTKAGEGKSTTSIGLADALQRLGKKTMLCLREPSMGPVFGLKGGAAGGGYAQVIPMEDINLHFTGDMHAITAANNLIAACIDNQLYWGNELQIDKERIVFKRCMDMNDRALRSLTVNRGSRKDRDLREDGFNITVASEIMAVLCLASDAEDLRERLDRILVAYTLSGEALYVRDLGISGALLLILKDALQPNLVQTLENTAALVHGGPFANIAHGCNSLRATKTALKLADYVVTEAGFAADLGAEKFLDIKCVMGGLKPKAAVLVATVRALKLHGGVAFDNLAEENLEALKQGLANLDRHAESLKNFGLETVVAINRFADDSEAELKLLADHCRDHGLHFALSEVFSQGGAGGEALAKAVLEALEAQGEANYRPVYALEDDFRTKLDKIVKHCYGADAAVLSEAAAKQLEELEAMGYGNLPLCMAKTPSSLSDDPKLLGAPTGFTIHVRELRLSAGAGFIVCLTGDVMTMPGLPRHPMAIDMDYRNGEILGLS